MRYRPFGRTGIEVSTLALGGHEYLVDGRSRGFNEDFKLAVTPGHVGQGYGGEKRLRVLQAAYDLGINYFDVTIDSEKEALGRNLAELPPPHQIYIQTRPEGMCYTYDEGNRKLLDYGLLRAEVERILGLIRRERIDFFNIGLLNWSIGRDPAYFDKLAVNIGRLKSENLIRFAIADSFSGEALYLGEIATGIFDGVNLDLNIGDRNPLKKVIPAARAVGLGLVTREVFMKGRLFAMAAEAGAVDLSRVAAMALRWAAANGPDTILCGVDTAEQLRANLAAIDDQSVAESDAALLASLMRTKAFASYAAERVERFFPAV